jgi:cellobiose-specific phosphotransferase system component IIB
MPPVVIAAGIGAAAGIGGAMLSSSAQKKAANKASDTALKTASQNNALQKEIYTQNYNLLAPFVNRGNQAGDAINSLLLSPNQNNAAFQNYLNSTGYQFQLDQGSKALQQGAMARGALQSGAASKALQTYGQNTATSFFKDYLGLLANQQGVGLSGGSAVAGVGQNYGNSVSANNNLAGSAAANAHLAAGNAQAGIYGNIAGGISGVANALASSYGQPKSTPPIYTPEQASWYQW